MSVYKNEDSGTWYVMTWYNNWKGEHKQKCKRGFPTKRGAHLPAPERRRYGYVL